MANYTENYNLVKPTMAETADIRTLNGNMDTVDNIMHDTQVSMADAFDSTASYAIRDLVMYEFKLYQCIHPHEGPWDADNWVRVNAAETGGNYVEITPTYNSGLKIADTNIDGDQDEIYVPYFGGATAQQNGTGGAVPAPTSSDVGKFLSSNGGWETPSGGGGTTVVPNPVGEPTDELETVRIGDTIFSIPGSGGGSGGHGFQITKIWDYVDDNSGSIPWGTETLTLNDDINNYDNIIVEMYSGSTAPSEASWNSTVQMHINVYALNHAVNPNRATFNSHGERTTSFYIDGTTLQKIANNGGSVNGITKVYGVKFGGSNGVMESVLATPVVMGSNTDIAVSDISNADLLIFDFGILTGDNKKAHLIGQMTLEALEDTTGYKFVGEFVSSYNISFGLSKTSDTLLHIVDFYENGWSDTVYMWNIYKVKYTTGGGNGYSETDLFVNTGSTNPSSIVMNDSIQNYDEIVIKVTRNAYGNTYKLQYRYTTSELELGDQIQCWCWGPNNEYFSYVLTAFDTFSNMAQGNALLCTKIIGIKH